MSARLMLVALALTGCSVTPRDDWSTGNTVAEVSFQLSNAVDAVQTSKIKDRADLVEGQVLTRKLIGHEPSTRDTAMYFASMGLSHYLISIALPAKWRPWFQGATFVYSSSTVYENCRHELMCGDGEK